MGGGAGALRVGGRGEALRPVVWSGDADLRLALPFRMFKPKLEARFAMADASLPLDCGRGSLVADLEELPAEIKAWWPTLRYELTIRTCCSAQHP